MKSIGIHQVPVTQKNTVKPFKKGSSDNKNRNHPKSKAPAKGDEGND